MLLTNTGRILRCSVSEIRITRRGAKGVILFRLNDEVSENETEELVTSVSRIDSISKVDDNIDEINNVNILENKQNNNTEEILNTDNNKEEEPLVDVIEDDTSLDDIFGR